MAYYQQPPAPSQQQQQQPHFNFYYYQQSPQPQLPQQPAPQHEGLPMLPLHILPVSAPASIPAVGCWPSAAAAAAATAAPAPPMYTAMHHHVAWQAPHAPLQPLPPPLQQQGLGIAMPALTLLPPAAVAAGHQPQPHAMVEDPRPPEPTSSMRQASTGTNTSSCSSSSRQPRQHYYAAAATGPGASGAKAASLSAAAAEIEAAFPSLRAPFDGLAAAGKTSGAGAEADGLLGGRRPLQRLERVVSPNIPGTGVFVFVPPAAQAARPQEGTQGEPAASSPLSSSDGAVEAEGGKDGESKETEKPSIPSPTLSRRRRAAGGVAKAEARQLPSQSQAQARQQRPFTELDEEAQLLMSREVRKKARSHGISSVD